MKLSIKNKDEDVIKEIAEAVDVFVGTLMSIASRKKPRGGQRFPLDLLDLLSTEAPVLPGPMLKLAKSMNTILDSGSVLDFGCGSGPHKKLFTDNGFTYVGLDYAESVDPKRVRRLGTEFEGEVVQYDGLTIPFEDNTFEAVWAWSSLEHCIYPEQSFAEISRILKPEGVFIGSVPHILPYHAESTINYTPYGFYLTCKRNGMNVCKLIPNMDGISFSIKSIAVSLAMIDDPVKIDQYFRENPVIKPFLKYFIEQGKRQSLSLALHAELCGEFGFIAVKS